MRVRIVHFSDLHLWHMPRSWHALFDKRVLGCMNHLLRRRRRFDRSRLERAVGRIAALAPDWIVCTGDLTTTGSPAEFAEACAVLKPFRTTALRGFLYVPGNHDCYVPDESCRKALDDTCRTLNDGKGLADFPFEIRDRGLRMFLVDESLPTAPWQSLGELPLAAGEWLAERLEGKREDGEGRVLIGHFPLYRSDGGELSWRRRLLGADRLRELAGSAALDVALCGHIHEGFRRDEPGAMEVCAGSLTLEGKVNVLDFSPDSCTFSQFWLDMSEDTPAPVLAGGQISATGVR